jgi:hypothetical protein
MLSLPQQFQLWYVMYFDGGVLRMKPMNEVVQTLIVIIIVIILVIIIFLIPVLLKLLILVSLKSLSQI